MKFQKYQIKHYNQFHLNFNFNVEQLVWLKVKNITLKWFLWKLDWQCYEPFKIIKKIDNVVYQFKLLKELHIHDVFHVSLLCDHKLQIDEDTSESESLHLVKDSAEREWEIEAITAS